MKRHISIDFVKKGVTVNSASYYKHDSKKMLLEPRSVKKVILIVFWDMKGPIIIDFLENGATVLRLAKSLDKIHFIY